MWCEILNIENSAFENTKDTILVYFKYNNKIVHAIISPRVLKRFKIDKIEVGMQLWIFKTFINDKEMYFIKKIKQNGAK